ncbi:MAG TPA: GNAT family N-acetyltransferase [Flavipsychrobacter sp.]|nr:GNAT family N-acetyltransferase [Flavipsychrobacter sp.]
MLSIQEANTNDISIIRDLAFRIWPQTYDPIVGAPQVLYMLDMIYSADALLQQMGNGQKFIIVYSDNLPIAFASYSEVETSVFKLHKLYVLPDLQGQGIGKQIVSYVIDSIKRNSATKLILNVNRHNISAKSFYEKLGFMLIREEDIDIDNGYFMNDYVFGLSLNNSI